jgi:uncharacterized protein Yka (UPF0111/DUF47 family)
MAKSCKETVDSLEEKIEELEDRVKELEEEVEEKDEEIDDLETQVYDLENNKANELYDGYDPVQVMKWELIIQNFGELSYLETVEVLRNLTFKKS